MRETTVLTAPAEKTADDVEITELEKIEAERVDGVGTPANGFPILMMKGIGVPAEPVIEDAVPVEKDAAAGCGCEPDCACCRGETTPSAKAAKVGERAGRYEALVKDKYSAGDRKKMAAAGQAMADGSYPIGDAQDLDNAIHAVGRGKAPHGKIRAHIKRRAKALGQGSKIPDSWKSGAGAEKGATLTKSQAQEIPEPDITPDVISKAVAEAMKPAQERIAQLADELAKVRSMPIPGGPQLITAHSPRPADQNAAATKAIRLRAIAAQTSDPDVKRSYLDLAAREEGLIPKG